MTMALTNCKRFCNIAKRQSRPGKAPDMENEKLIALLYKKIQKEWPEKWAERHGVQFTRIEDIPNKHQFYEDLIDDMYQAMVAAHGLEKAASIPLNKRTLIRVFQEGYTNIGRKYREVLLLYLQHDSHLLPEIFHTPEETGTLSKTARTRKTLWGKPLNWAVALLLLVLAGWLGLGYLYQLVNPTAQGVPILQFLTPVYHSAPHTVRLFLDATAWPVDSLYISFGEWQGGLSYYKTLPNRPDTLSYVYQKPFAGQMVISGKAKDGQPPMVLSQHITVQSSGWQAWALQAPYEYMLPSRSLCQQGFAPGMLYLGPEKIPEKIRLDYFTFFRAVQDFPARLDSCTLEVRLQNYEGTGGIDCFDTQVELMGEHGEVSMYFLRPGCTYWANWTIGNQSESGHKGHNVEFLGQDFSDWRTVKLRLKKPWVEVWLDGKLLVQKTYKGELGKLEGIGLMFKGSG
jgi:hypothetical protein